MVQSSRAATGTLHPDSAPARVFALLDGSLASATIELFKSYDISVTRTPVQPPEDREACIVASIGFTSEKARGTLWLIVPTAAPQSWRRDEGALGPDEALDTVGEFSNMLLGQLKNKMLANGLVLVMATPSTTFGDPVRVRRPAGPAVVHSFASGAGPIEVRLHASFDPDFALALTSARRGCSQPPNTREMMFL